MVTANDPILAGHYCIRVISFRANTIKRDATAEELRKVLQYVEQAA
jgi:hypothetical protein